MRAIPAELCVKCKGHKYLCGLPYCPLMERFRSIVNSLQKVKINQESKLVDGSTPPSAIVGERGYPKVTLILNLPPSIHGEEARNYENPLNWWGKVSLGEIIKLRSSLISAMLKTDASKALDLYNTEIPLTVISENPVDSEAKLKKLEAKLKFDGRVLPRGPGGPAEEFKVTDNPKIPAKLDKLIFDDVKAQEAIYELYKHNIDYYKIINALSFGLLGQRKRRKLVPTRWAITAVDSMIGKELQEKISEYNELNQVEVYYSSYLGNYFHIILYPSKYTSTWIEIWHPLSLWSTELLVSELSENYWGEYDYMDGGYLAARLGVLEYLEKIKRQAGIIIIREITSEYYAPVGNWHIRETVRRAMENRLGKFESTLEAILFVNNRLKAKIDLLELNSIRKILKQRKIDEFFK
ncbi:hypothetical protein BFU36_01845 [Sulfolobus sp. A20]|uniref:Nre family DNA repair protein n=1 Tax=Sulfolobaceae TaxID=118883 RepID=UPI000846030B|nr:MULTISPECIES: Nre family DNA repair protein [unclassified Sulfolobus]TRM74586.1 hypothetical protein DJ523_04565 [Sulfolobus sp. E5]TRM75115.1 hypothetical protein DJ528_09685 [Sulfolobus sp. B5]TRM78196.1 hypothetical protein DJ532_02255 [Sulfolobus sp. A20-N-F8]TRM81621.1 hypothetical protein DJ524_03475 [Sulfolobus sp. D5]TRM82880.1 hypothetical protein DJ531_07930 [Sulfolobus sp. A20-N-F6]TRM86408.1 hypothetical protein DJ521_05615 [Sulfolobus sp. E3]TRM88859.1 hypothetical protein DJ